MQKKFRFCTYTYVGMEYKLDKKFVLTLRCLDVIGKTKKQNFIGCNTVWYSNGGKVRCDPDMENMLSDFYTYAITEGKYTVVNVSRG